MGKFLKNTLMLRMKRLWLAWAGILGTFVLGHLCLWLEMTFDSNPETSFELGTVVMLFGMVFLSFVGSTWYWTEFNYALSMSRKRRHIITAGLFVSLVEYAIGVLVMWSLCELEHKLCLRMWDAPCESNIAAFLEWKSVLLLALALAVVENIFGAIYTRIGTKYAGYSGLVLVLVVNLPNILPNIIGDAFDSNKLEQAILHTVHWMQDVAVWGILVGILLLLATLPYLILRKERVKL